MKITFRDIPSGSFRARVSEIKEETGAYGPYLRITFRIIESGDLNHYRFSGIVKPTPLKQSRFYRWAKNILGKEPGDVFSPQEMIGKECHVSLSKKNGYYLVTDVSMISDDV
jgi:hypothetical protein